MKSRKNNIYVISGPSGVGKSTLAEKLLANIDNLKKTISYTTRIKRAEEIDGVDYHFIRKSEFERKIESLEFIEWVKIYDNYYGTTFSILEKMLPESNLLMVIDMDGAKNIKNEYPENTVLTYILPPGFDELKRRLQDRACNTSKEDQEKRLQAAKEEIKKLYSGEMFYDHVIANDDFDECYEKQKSIITFPERKLSHITDIAKYFDPDFLK